MLVTPKGGSTGGGENKSVDMAGSGRGGKSKNRLDSTVSFDHMIIKAAR